MFEVVEARNIETAGSRHPSGVQMQGTNRQIGERGQLLVHLDLASNAPSRMD